MQEKALEHAMFEDLYYRKTNNAMGLTIPGHLDTEGFPRKEKVPEVIHQPKRPSWENFQNIEFHNQALV